MSEGVGLNTSSNQYTLTNTSNYLLLMSQYLDFIFFC